MYRGNGWQNNSLCIANVWDGMFIALNRAGLKGLKEYFFCGDGESLLSAKVTSDMV